jgi:hypothetical protein
MFFVMTQELLEQTNGDVLDIVVSPCLSRSFRFLDVYGLNDAVIYCERGRKIIYGTPQSYKKQCRMDTRKTATYSLRDLDDSEISQASELGFIISSSGDFRSILRDSARNMLICNQSLGNLTFRPSYIWKSGVLKNMLVSHIFEGQARFYGYFTEDFDENSIVRVDDILAIREPTFNEYMIASDSGFEYHNIGAFCARK